MAASLSPPTKISTLRDITGSFLYLGMSAFGGLAMVEPMRRRVVEDRSWLSQTEFLDGLALCQMLPGATVVQLATYVGYRLRGALGALVAAAGFILPAFFLMLGLSFLYFRYGHLPWLQSISRGLNAMVIALLLQALWHLGRSISRHWLDLTIALLTLLALWGHGNYLLVFLSAAMLRLALEMILPSSGRISVAGSRQPSSGDSFPVAKPQTASFLITGLAVLFGVTSLVWILNQVDFILGQMALIFLKIGAVSFGGGYVMIPVLQWEVVERLGWLTTRQFLDGILLGYVTPGPLIILATFVGYAVKGLAGAALATVAVFLPPILCIIFLSPFYYRLKETRWMRPALQGILAALVGMLALVTAQMARLALTDWKDLALLAASATALMGFKVNLLWILGAVAGVSLLIY